MLTLSTTCYVNTELPEGGRHCGLTGARRQTPALKGLTFPRSSQCVVNFAFQRWTLSAEVYRGSAKSPHVFTEIFMKRVHHLCLIVTESEAPSLKADTNNWVLRRFRIEMTPRLRVNGRRKAKNIPDRWCYTLLNKREPNEISVRNVLNTGGRGWSRCMRGHARIRNFCKK